MTGQKEKQEGELTMLVEEMIQVANDCYNLSLTTTELVDMLKLSTTDEATGKEEQNMEMTLYGRMHSLRILLYSIREKQDYAKRRLTELI